MKPAVSMKAAVLESPNAPFQVADVRRPKVEGGQVLVRIEASGVNPLDMKIRAGQAAHARHPLPAIGLNRSRGRERRLAAEPRR
jgi:NADPH2:quinone reductase